MSRGERPDRHWSSPAAADKNRSRSPGNVGSSEGDHLRAGWIASRNAGEILADLIEGLLGDHVDGHADGIGKSQRIGTAVTLYGDAVETEEDGAVIAPRICAHAQRVQGWPRQEIAEARHHRALEAAAQELGIELRRALKGLQRHIAREAVGDDDVDGPARNVVAFDEAMKAAGKRRLLQDRSSFA